MVLSNTPKKISKNIRKRKYKEFKSKEVRTVGYYSIIMFLVLVLADRFTKIWASTSGNKDHGLIAITYTINTGAGFSIMTGMNTILIIISVLAASAIIYFQDKIKIPKFSSLTIISGITGNVIDRIFYGGVIDFINFKFWPIFNIADSLIVIGVLYWVIILLISKEQGNKLNNRKK
jgi:signal peptidase II